MDKLKGKTMATYEVTMMVPMTVEVSATSPEKANDKARALAKKGRQDFKHVVNPHPFVYTIQDMDAIEPVDSDPGVA